MTLPLIKPAGWNPNDPLTSAQMNAFQGALIQAIDGVNGGTFTLSAMLTLAGALVRITNGLEIVAAALVVDSGAALQVDGPMTLSGNLTQTGNTALTGDINVNINGDININDGGDFQVKDGGSAVVASGGKLMLLSGAELDVFAATLVDFASTLFTMSGAMSVPAGGIIDLEDDAVINVLDGGKILGSSGGEIQVFAADDLTINGSSFVWRSTMTPTFFDPAWGQLVSGTPTWCMRTTTTNSPIGFALPLRPGDTLTTVRVTLRGGAGAGHGGVSPTTMPRVQLISVSSAGVATVIRQVDDPVTGPAYDSSHSITLSGSGLPLVVGTDPLYVKVLCESGANRVDNTTVVTMIDGTGEARSFRGQNEVL